MTIRVLVIALLLPLLFASDAWSTKRKPGTTTTTQTPEQKQEKCWTAYNSCVNGCSKWDNVDMGKLDTCVTDCQTKRDRCLARAGNRTPQ
jgi:hypothetical protein